MAAAPEFHIHFHGLDEVLAHLHRFERLLMTGAEKIDQLTARITAFGEAQAAQTALIADIKGDFSALLAAMNADRETLTEAQNAALDAANEAFNARVVQNDEVNATLADLDATVGEHDGLPEPTPGE